MAGSSADAALTVTTQTLPEDGSIQIMPDSRVVTLAGEQIALTRMEFDLLVFLAEHPRRVFFRSQLLQSVWGYKVTGERTVDVHVRRLRVKLGDSFVTTVRGVGYRLADEARVRIVHLPHK
jgi:DNA-binding response OmpR family regulator